MSHWQYVANFSFCTSVNQNTLQIDDNWNYTESLDAGGEHRLPSFFISPSLQYYSTYLIDSPEFGPGSFIGPSSELPDVTPTSSSSTDSSGGSSSHAGGIAGGVIGGVVGLIITPAAIILYLRRRLRARAAVPADVSEVSPSFPVTTRLYVRDLVFCVALVSSGFNLLLFPYNQNPGDPNTFPEYQGILHSLDIPPQITMSSNIGTGNAVTQPSLPQAGLARGYHGLPTV